jgi:hypothetical protein
LHSNSVHRAKSYLSSLEHTNINFKKRKIKVGDNYNIDMEHFYDKLKNCLDEDVTEYERHEMKKVWSSDSLPENEIEAYLKDCRLFWNYRNFLLETDSCTDFYKKVKALKKEKLRLSSNQKFVIVHKVKQLKEFVKFGVNLNNHFEEMCLKILHICKYSTKKAILFLYNNLNPFIEGNFILFIYLFIYLIEEETSFKSDINFFQKEILAIFSDEESDNSYY